jgi:hypothetical protein
MYTFLNRKASLSLEAAFEVLANTKTPDDDDDDDYDDDDYDDYDDNNDDYDDYDDDDYDDYDNDDDGRLLLAWKQPWRSWRTLKHLSKVGQVDEHIKWRRYMRVYVYIYV